MSFISKMQLSGSRPVASELLDRWVGRWIEEGCPTYGGIDGLCVNTWVENMNNPQPIHSGIMLSPMTDLVGQWNGVERVPREGYGVGYAAIYINKDRIRVVKYDRGAWDTVIKVYKDYIYTDDKFNALARAVDVATRKDLEESLKK